MRSLPGGRIRTVQRLRLLRLAARRRFRRIHRREGVEPGLLRRLALLRGGRDVRTGRRSASRHRSGVGRHRRHRRRVRCRPDRHHAGTVGSNRRRVPRHPVRHRSDQSRIRAQTGIRRRELARDRSGGVYPHADRRPGRRRLHRRSRRGANVGAGPQSGQKFRYGRLDGQSRRRHDPHPERLLGDSAQAAHAERDVEQQLQRRPQRMAHGARGHRVAPHRRASAHLAPLPALGGRQGVRRHA